MKLHARVVKPPIVSRTECIGKIEATGLPEVRSASARHLERGNFRRQRVPARRSDQEKTRSRRFSPLDTKDRPYV